MADLGAGTGLIGAAYAIARSFQPNLLTRKTTDQAIITGVGAASAYGLFSAGDSVVNAMADRFTPGDTVSPAARIAVAGIGGIAAAGTALALPWAEHEDRRRAWLRLAAQTSAAVAAASLGSTVTARAFPRRSRLAIALTATAVGVGTWASTRTWQARPGSLLQEKVDGATVHDGQYFWEDNVRQVSPAQTAGIGVGVALATYGLSKAESALTTGASHAARLVLGGQAEDRRALGRILSAATTVGIAWFAVSRVSALLAKGGGSIEPAHSTPPSAAEITGSPASGVEWAKVTREGARWLSMALEPAGIESIMGTTGAKQPIRVYSSLDMNDTPFARAKALLAEIDRTRALERSVFVLFSPTGSGYVNYVATETLEYLTNGDCASACVQYSVLPSALSLGDVDTGTEQTLMVLNGITERLMAMPADKRPRFYIFGESLGSQVSEDMFKGTDILGLDGTGLTGALWIGTPSATRWKKELWGTRSYAQTPEVGPGAVYIPRNLLDWHEMPSEQRREVRFLLLQNGDDPIPKFGTDVAWLKPAWLGPEESRPVGSPRGTRWVPGLTFLTTFFDMQEALLPTPGVFAEGGHDYRLVLPTAISETWDLPMSPEQSERMGAALRERELAWELHRDWTAAEAKPADKQDEAKAKALKTASKYTGHAVDEAELQAIVAKGLQPR